MYIERTIPIEEMLDWRLLWCNNRLVEDVIMEYSRNGAKNLAIVHAVQRIRNTQAELDRIVWEADVLSGADHKARKEIEAMESYQAVERTIAMAVDLVYAEYTRETRNEGLRIFEGLLPKDKPNLSLVKPT